MQNRCPVAARIATIVGLTVLCGSPGLTQSSSPPATGPSGALGRACNTLGDLLAGDQSHPGPRKRLPIDETTKSEILHSGLPCAETVDTNGPDPTGLQNLQHGFDFISWRTFIALNSPADGTNVDIEHSQPDTPTQWEDMKNFKQLLDVMLPPNVKPPVWGKTAEEREAEKLRLMPAACVPQYKTGMMVIKMIEETFNQPFKTGPLIDQDGHYALFDILMNKAMFDYISENHLFSKPGQQEQIRSGLAIDFPSGQNPDPVKHIEGGAGAIMIKVSWKILNQDEIRSRKFHTVNALVSLPQPDPNVRPPCLPETLGLVGFHVVHKTVGRPQWIWTSFEHVDNVPEQREVDAGPLARRFSFFDHSCSADTCKPNQTPPWPWEPDPARDLKFHGSFNSQITRVTPLTDATVEINTAFQKLLNGTVWQNYMLISTQWPSNFDCTKLRSANTTFPFTDFRKQPDMTCAPAPTFLANSTLETYSQGDVPLASSSCIGCHGNATDFQTAPANANAVHFNQSDFTFMLEKAQ
jgi:hypothetical protein